MGKTPIYRQAKLKCLVGGISSQHNFNEYLVYVVGNSINPEGTEVMHCESGLRLADICNFGGCPWVRLDPG